MAAALAGSRARIVIAFAFLYIVWGSTYLGIRVCVEQAPPLLFAGSRNLLAGCLSLLGAFLIQKAPCPSFRQVRDASVMGLFLFLGGNGGVAWAEQTIPSGVACLLLGTTPFWMVLFNRALHAGAPLPKGAWAGIALGFAGLAVLVNPFASGDLGRLDPWGCGVAILSSILWSAGSVWGSRRDLPSAFLVSAGVQLAAGGLGALALGALLGEGAKFDWNRITPSGLWAYAYLIVFGTFVGFMAFYYVLRRTQPHVVASYSYVNPVVAVFLGYWFLGESLGPRTIGSTALIVAGVALMLWSSKPTTAPEGAS